MTTAPIPNEPMPERPGSDRPRPDRPQVEAGRLWSGGIATAVVAGLVALVGVLVCRWLFGIPLLAPKQDGAYGDAHTTGLVLMAAAGALLATGLVHLLVLSTPRPLTLTVAPRRPRLKDAPHLLKFRCTPDSSLTLRRKRKPIVVLCLSGIVKQPVLPPVDRAGHCLTLRANFRSRSEMGASGVS